MGLFSRKTKISVASVIYPLGEEPDKVPDVVKAAAITASLRHTNVAAAIKTSIIDGGGVKLTQAYNYALKNYYTGMPKGLPYTRSTTNDGVLNVLCKEYLQELFPGDVVEVLATSVTNANDYDTVVQGLITTEYSYDFAEDEVLVASGSIDVGATLTYDGPFLDSLHPSQIGYELLFTNPDTSTVAVSKWYASILFDGADVIRTRVTMQFTLNGGPSASLSYASGGTSNRLNVYLRSYTTPVSGTYPGIVLKKNNVYLDSDSFSGEPWETSSAYRTTKAYANRLGVNVDDMLSMVKDNPDADEIDYAFIQPGLLINSPSKAVVKYFFTYFHKLYLTGVDNKSAFDAWVAQCAYPAVSNVSKGKAENCPAQSVRFADPETPESSVDIELAWRYISYEEKSGVIDGYEVECGAQETVTARYIHSTPRDEVYDITKVYFRKALSPTTYAEICVCGLWHENYVYKGHSVQSGVWDAFNDPEGDYGTGFLVPLDYTVLIELSQRERLQLSQEALHIIFNCYVAKKQKWYQTGIFKVFLAIVSIVAIVATVGAATPYVTAAYNTIYASLFITLGATLATAIAVFLTAVVVAAYYVGVSFVSEEVGDWAAEKWGALWGAIAQIGTAILMTQSLMRIPTMPSIPPASLAEQVFRVGTGVASTVSAYTNYQYSALQDEIKTWEDYVKSDNNPLEEVNKLLEEMFPDMGVAQLAILPHKETLDEFLSRTLTTTDGLIGRLTAPITEFSELTLTTRLP